MTLTCVEQVLKSGPVRESSSSSSGGTASSSSGSATSIKRLAPASPRSPRTPRASRRVRHPSDTHTSSSDTEREEGTTVICLNIRKGCILRYLL